MPDRLRIVLLGGFLAGFEDGESCRLSTRKSEALLAYLAVPTGRFHTRDKLATLLWGDTPETQARQSLRQALGSIRRALGPGHEQTVQVQGDAVALKPGAVTVDVTDLELTLADGRMEALERAATLYKGDFLAGVRVDETPFEEWRTVERERLHELALEGLVKLLREQVAADRADPAIQTSMRILAMDPLQETVHRTLMRLLAGQGRRAAALRQYQTCVACLLRELSAEPEEETRQLYREILRTTHAGLDRSGAAAAGPSAARAPTTATRPVEVPMVGRVAELEHIRGANSRMLDDGRHVVLVTGESGIGKSRLIQEFVTSDGATGTRICFGRCYETEQTLPFRPWIEALRGDGSPLSPGVRGRLGAAASAQLAPIFPHLLGARDAAITPGVQPALLFEPLLELISALASEQPVAIIIEDLHWADTMSAQFLAFLGRRIQRVPVLILGSMRPEELVDAPALVQALKELRTEGWLDEVALGALSEAECRALGRSLRPSPRTDRAWDQLEGEIWTLSEGNPFIVVESIRSLQQDTSETWSQKARPGRRVQEVVAERLERLAELPRHCVAVAATIGRDFPFALLARAGGLSEREAADAVEQLVRRRILDTVGDRLDFCHDWIRLVAYEGLLPPKRAVLHAAVGDALEALHRDHLDEITDQLGNHYSKAADFRKAIPHLVRFGYLAALRYALDDSARALAQAMAGVGQLPPSERDRWRLDVALRQAFVLSILGRQREILELLGSLAGTVKQAADGTLISEYYFRLGLTHFFLGERVQAQLAAEHALEQGERVGNGECIGKALHVLSLEAYEMGRPEDGIAHATRAIALLDQPHTRAWLGLVYQDLALNYVVAGDLDAALAANAQVDAIGRTGFMPRLQAFSGYVGAWVHTLRGDTELAIETARGALEISRDTMVTGLISGTLGNAYLEQGDAGTAVSLLTQVVDQLKSSPVRNVEIRNTALLGEALLQAGDAARARETAGRALELGQADGMPLNVGLAQRALGRIALAGGDVAQAEGYLSEALETFTGCGARFEAGRTHLDLATLRAARGDKDAARAHLAPALAVFKAANAPKRADATRDLARAWGIALAEI